MKLNLPEFAVSDRVSMVKQVTPHEKTTFAELEGPGCIRHIFIATNRTPFCGRRVIVRIYFDGAEVPHVEAPLSDLCGVMHGLLWYPVNSLYLSVKHDGGYDMYFPMPFAKSARIEFETPNDTQYVYIHVDWHRYPGQELEEPLRFCARWRREYPTERYGDDFLILDADGPGRLVGLVYAVRLIDNVDRWSHGGADNIYVDGEGDYPVYMRGTGGEDTFGVGWGGALHKPETNLYSSIPYYLHEDVGDARPAQRVVGYRFFEQDSITFRESIHMRFGCMQNDIAATAYWYQEKPVRPFFRMPSWDDLLPWKRFDHEKELPRGTYDIELPSSGEWWVCGPFANDKGQAMGTELPPECEFNPETDYDGLHNDDSGWLTERSRELGRDRARWLRRKAHHGFIDFRHVFRPCMRGASPTYPGVAFARTAIEAQEDITARVQVTWDDELVLWVNGRKIDMGHHPSFRSETLDVPLKEGGNEILIKLSNDAGTNYGGWCFAFKATTPDGAVLSPRVE